MDIYMMLSILLFQNTVFLLSSNRLMSCALPLPFSDNQGILEIRIQLKKSTTSHLHMLNVCIMFQAIRMLEVILVTLLVLVQGSGSLEAENIDTTPIYQRLEVSALL